MFPKKIMTLILATRQSAYWFRVDKSGKVGVIYLDSGPGRSEGCTGRESASACARASACRSALSALKIAFMANQNNRPTTSEGRITATYSMDQCPSGFSRG